MDFNAAPSSHVQNQSAIGVDKVDADVIITDPPYYDAIPYSDLWTSSMSGLRRSLVRPFANN